MGKVEINILIVISHMIQIRVVNQIKLLKNHSDKRMLTTINASYMLSYYYMK